MNNNSKERLPRYLFPSDYMADPSAHVFNGRLYIYPSHDRETGAAFDDDGGHFQMRDYHVLSLDDVEQGPVADHGVILDQDQVPWAEKQLWDSDVVEHQGRYYLIFSAKDYNGEFHLGVAIADRPEGPFVAEPQPIRGSYSIDPCVFKDDDGSIYCYFGGLWGGQLQWHAPIPCRTAAGHATQASPSASEPCCTAAGHATPASPSAAATSASCPVPGCCAAGEAAPGAAPSSASCPVPGCCAAGEVDLGPAPDRSTALRAPADAPALPSRVVRMSGDVLQFAEAPRPLLIVDDEGQPLRAGDPHRFFEASWLHKHQGTYYFSYSTGDSHLLCYATSDNPYGPFRYRGVLLEPVVGWTTHHCITQYQGQWYLFFHDSVPSGGVTHLRSLKVQRLYHRPDGTIAPVVND